MVVFSVKPAPGNFIELERYLKKRDGDFCIWLNTKNSRYYYSFNDDEVASSAFIKAFMLDLRPRMEVTTEVANGVYALD